ncbi:crosslink repair DNA glycosylase YcaQ family protein [Octadecabacter sp. 1_MG-2023]|uniref:winged helix-turn-helix domain-containing protein n=1 Tax=unclassified Octadecabacter TaxID=196158 RepID=UPI001C082A4F|nr:MULTISPECIES: crosslink repair DNA glycosylase YcaQ family protein [unclassified Octadecabacter]MBU2992556.1 winged helix DNA-binding domain-containing protein [Octadecabacter sp. B2R22]MDO6734687.1 crosslink repair DNA glycosylase YcaQ family protein [Octadecabacter sp. 1_MG-2023]
MRPVIDNQTARRLFLDRHLLLGSRSGSGKGDDLQSVIDHLGFVQVDSVNTLARAHDLILWSRRQQYRAPNLPRLMKSRGAFEHWTHDASVISMQHFPMWRYKFAKDKAHMDAKWPAWRREGFRDQIDGVLRQITDHGRCSSMEVGADEERKSGGWWDWHPSKTALEYLWRSGELSVCHRKGFRKIYDLTERVIPDEYRNTEVSEDEMIDWACMSALKSLGFATSGEIAAFYAIITPAQAKTWCAMALNDQRIAEVNITSADGTLRPSFILPETLDLKTPEPNSRVRLLSPFDPALRDRKRAERLFDFHYRIEIFVPAPKRKYGYYVFPVMQGDRMIGRIDTKRDGDATLVTAFWPGKGIRMGKARIKALEAEVDRVAKFVGSNDVNWSKGWNKETS